MKKLFFLEALRGYAILGVVITHVVQKMDNVPIWLNNIGIQGARGVQLFFIVSAFTLFLSLSNKYTAKQFELSDFFVRRFFRIAPAFYIAFICYSVVDIILYNVSLKGFHNDYSMGMILSTLSFTSIIHPDWLFSLVPGGWSISIEMLFYVCVPFLFLFIKNKKNSLYLLIATLIIGWSINALVYKNNLFSESILNDNYLFYWFPSQIGIFAIGIYMYHLWKDKSTVISKWSNVLIYSGVLLLVLLSFTGNIYNPMFPKHYLFGLGFLLFGLGLSAVDKHFLLNKVILFIGKISFSMYLVHFFVLDVLETLFLSSLMNYTSTVGSVIILYIFTLIISVILSHLSFKYVETPGIKIGRNISKQIEKRKNIKKLEDFAK